MHPCDIIPHPHSLVSRGLPFSLITIYPIWGIIQVMLPQHKSQHPQEVWNLPKFYTTMLLLLVLWYSVLFSHYELNKKHSFAVSCFVYCSWSELSELHSSKNENVNIGQVFLIWIFIYSISFRFFCFCKWMEDRKEVNPRFREKKKKVWDEWENNSSSKWPCPSLLESTMEKSSLYVCPSLIYKVHIKIMILILKKQQYFCWRKLHNLWYGPMPCFSCEARFDVAKEHKVQYYISSKPCSMTIHSGHLQIYQTLQISTR